MSDGQTEVLAKAQTVDSNSRDFVVSRMFLSKKANEVTTLDNCGDEYKVMVTRRQIDG